MLQKPFFLFLCAFVFCAAVHSQPLELSIADQKKPPIINTYMVAMRTEKTIPVDSIHAGNYDNQFTDLKDPVFVFDKFDNATYWFKFAIKNNFDTSRRSVLILGPTGVKNAELFQVHNGHIRSLGKTGYQYPFAARPYQYMHYAYPIDMAPNATDSFYLKADYYYEFVTYGFGLVDLYAFRAYENKVYFLFGMIVGLLSLFLVFNLFVSFVLREKVHAWYAAYIAMLVLVVLKNDQLDDQFLGTDSETGYRLFFLMGVGSLAIGVLMQVVQLYLKNISHESRLYTIFWLVKWNVVISSFVLLVVYYFTARLDTMEFLFYYTDYSAAAGIVLIVSACVYSAKKGFKPALFILTGFTVFLVGAMEKLTLRPHRSLLFPLDTFHLGMVMEVIIISFGFIYSFRVERRATREMEKNFRNELQKAEDEIQQQTLKTISQEIHNNIGQVLTLAKLTLNTTDANDINSVKEKISSSSLLLTKAIQDLRDLSRTLHTDNVKDLGLIKAMEAEVQLMRNTGTFNIEMDVVGNDWHLPQQYELILFRVFQEGVNNIIKHARAKNIRLLAGFRNTQFEMKVADDGIGFDTDDLENKLAKGMGLRNMKNRTKIIGAELSIQSTPGRGTSITVTMADNAVYHENQEIYVQV